MNEIMSYIFSSLQKNDAALATIAKAFKSQVKFNRSVTIFTVATAIYVCANERRCNKLEKEIRELRKDVDELTGKKAENEVEADE